MWFLTGDVLQEMKQARASGFTLSAEQVADLRAASRDNGKMQVVGREAIIPVEGVLTERPDWFAAYFGGGNTTYPDIKQAIAEANGSPEIDSITMAYGYVPGGNVTGLFSTMDAIRDSEKPITATVKGGAMSGGFGLASQAGRIVAADRGTQFGSVGVAMDTWVYDGNIKEVSVSSTEAPKKRPDLLTDEGRAVVREELDAIHDVFVESIADGRGTTVKKVNANFGQGAMVLAEQALKAGMIDSIGVEQSAPQQSAPEAAETKEVRSMDLQKLKTEYPAVYDAAVAVGRDAERDRVCAHLKMGSDSGDMETAVTAITDGSDMTMTLTATYMSAARNKALTDARVDDNQDVTVEPEAQGGDDFDRQVAKAMEAGAEREGMIHG